MAVLRERQICDQAPEPEESAFSLGVEQGKALLEQAEQAVLPDVPKTQCDTNIIAQSILAQAQDQVGAFAQQNPICDGYQANDLATAVDLAQAEASREEGLEVGLQEAFEALRVRLVSTWECENCICYAGNQADKSPQTAHATECYAYKDVVATIGPLGPNGYQVHDDIVITEDNWAVPHPVYFRNLDIPTISPSECSSLPIPVDSPLVADLDGDGIQISRVRVAFDLSATGQKVRMPGLRGADAFLALDLDGSGTIDSGAELFGNRTGCGEGFCTDGIRALAQYDANHDGRIDDNDPTFGRLRFWRDANRDGKSQPGELSTLPEQGVVTVKLEAHTDQAFADQQGNSAIRSLTFVKRDGSTGMMPDVWFGLK